MRKYKTVTKTEICEEETHIECDYCGTVGGYVKGGRYIETEVLLHSFSYHIGYPECDSEIRDVCDQCLLPFFREAVKDVDGSDDAVIEGIPYALVKNLLHRIKYGKD